MKNKNKNMVTVTLDRKDAVRLSMVLLNEAHDLVPGARSFGAPDLMRLALDVTRDEYPGYIRHQESQCRIYEAVSTAIAA